MDSAFRIEKSSGLNSGIESICLGTAQFGFRYGIANEVGQISLSEAKRILDTAFDLGVRMVDTAIAYGESESVLGGLGLGGWKVVTKIPRAPEACGDVGAWLTAQVHGSVKRLGVTELYALLLHHPDQLRGSSGSQLLESFKAMKAEGLASKIGVSVYSPEELESVCELFCPDIIQCPVNILDRRLDTSGWLQRLSSNGVEIHARSVFLQGLLLMPRHKLPANFRGWAGLWDEWHTWLEENNAPAQEVCLSYVRSLSGISKIVVGIDNLPHLEALAAQIRSPARVSIPTLQCNDAELVNPALWDKL
jgi:aryl-alcohol dehydrogenase-like predicted oxidoreductase